MSVSSCIILMGGRQLWIGWLMRCHRPNMRTLNQETPDMGGVVEMEQQLLAAPLILMPVLMPVLMALVALLRGPDQWSSSCTQ